MRTLDCRLAKLHNLKSFLLVKGQLAVFKEIYYFLNEVWKMPSSNAYMV